ncbi:MAG: hypothetical protein IPN87_13805 [Saprospiraceae bacterium]|nr:hypothetical protein [Candidatus Brachybacter algidus]
MRQIITYSLFLLLLSCTKEDTTSKPYNVNGRVINNSGIGMEGVSIAYGDAKSVITDAQGYWMINDLIDENTFTPALNNFTFNPTNIKVSASINGVLFIGTENQVPLKQRSLIGSMHNNYQMDYWRVLKMEILSPYTTMH